MIARVFTTDRRRGLRCRSSFPYALGYVNGGADCFMLERLLCGSVSLGRRIINTGPEETIDPNTEAHSDQGPKCELRQSP